MKMKINLLFLTPLVILGCTKPAFRTILPQTESVSDGVKTLTSAAAVSSFFAMGADVGFLSQMEDSGKVFYNRNGVQEDCLQILKEQGINSIRLRAWVNPSKRYCGTADLVTMAMRAKAKGFHILIDFHYSDTWADNTHQKKPAAWANDSFPQLLTDVYNYTYHVMDTLKSNGITPDWVQVGNEINEGMLLPDGARSNPSNLAQLINQGYAAIKAVSPNSQVIIHIAGESESSEEGFFDNLISNGANFDILGFSYYPYYNNQTFLQSNAGMISTLKDLSSRYGKKTMVVETGALWTDSLNTFNGLNDCINRLSEIPNANGIGIFYWEPESYYSYNHYKLNAFDTVTQAPTHAMDAFLYNPAINLINNPDFETGSAEHSSITGWSVYSNNNYDAIYTTTGGYTGTYRLSHYKTTAYTASTYQDLIGVPNGTYMLTAWIQNSGGQTTCEMYAKGSGAEIDLPLPVTGSWKQVFIKNIQVTNGTAAIGFRSVANAGNWCHVDNVHFQLQ